MMSCIPAEPSGQQWIDEYLTKMGQDLPNSKIILTGYQVLQPTCQVPDKIQLMWDFESLISLADNA